MSYRSLVAHFATVQNLPVAIDDVISWVREHTDHKSINLFAVSRKKKAFRGAFRRRAVSTATTPYDHDSDNIEIITDILYGDDLPEDWKRLVICKELLHVFDPQSSWVDSSEKLRKLIPAIITPELRGAPFEPAADDVLGAYKALAVLLPRDSRRLLADAVKLGSRTIAEVATFVKIPDFYVDIWLREGEGLESVMCEFYK